MHAPGIYIGFAGPNNIGKTTQAKRLTEYLERQYGRKVEQIKFPLYTLEPHGPVINRYFRDPAFRALEQVRRGMEAAERNIAAMVVANHHQYEEVLQTKLREGIILVVEDCVMNSVAWTIASGYTEEQAMQMHKGLAFGDVTILLNEIDGRSYSDAIEKGHVNEGKWERQQKARYNMLNLAGDHLFKCERVDFELAWTKEIVFSYVLQALQTRIVV